jgi:hypothetical protein
MTPKFQVGTILIEERPVMARILSYPSNLTQV